MTDAPLEATPDVVDEPAAAPEPDPTAREWLQDVLAPLLPRRWHLVWDEGTVDDTGRTRLRLTQQSIERHPSAGTGAAHLVSFAATVTVPTEDFDTAEADLDDELEALLWALDSIGLVWGKADKAMFGNRLGYSFTIQLATFRKAP